ncbi:MAG TPA: hypothetical protein VI454_02005 [Verrucomicrobiae bacterium]|jgi:hypothetical protein
MAHYEEQLIINFLKASPKTYYSATEIARKAGDRQMYEVNPRWAAPLLGRMLEKELIDSDDQGHYRFMDPIALAEHRRKAKARMGRG